MQHYHGYAWTGPAGDMSLKQEYRRRPPELAYNKLPPLLMWQWLLKPPEQIQDSFKDVASAITWYRARYDEILPRIYGDIVAITIDEIAETAAKDLKNGRAACWGYHLDGGYRTFNNTSLVSCPNLMAPGQRCPLRAR